MDTTSPRGGTLTTPKENFATDKKSAIHSTSVPVSPRTAQNKNKRRYQSLPRSAYKLTVNETVIAGSKKLSNNFGMPAYEVVRRGDRGEFWHHDINKPIVFGIHKEKVKGPKHYLDDTLKVKK